MYSTVQWTQEFPVTIEVLARAVLLGNLSFTFAQKYTTTELNQN